ncbi:MAG: hypothetical protein B6245_14635 [Desulfobacteraceae bacterium 4572_88]|nr:MAG: hypothetical protein B6245_14635 [Desulfobacteraceae bacterium 4572_88]RLC14036.1 MAG: hypothetical protein DRI57_15145 [Deltaproteobacteria bacterium]
MLYYCSVKFEKARTLQASPFFKGGLRGIFSGRATEIPSGPPLRKRGELGGDQLLKTKLTP